MGWIVPGGCWLALELRWPCGNAKPDYLCSYVDIHKLLITTYK